MKYIVEGTSMQRLYAHGRIVDDRERIITRWNAGYNRSDRQWEVSRLNPTSSDAAKELASAKAREHIIERLSTWEVPSSDISREQEL